MARFAAINGGGDGTVSHQQLDLLIRGLADVPTLPAVAARMVAVAGTASFQPRPAAEKIAPVIRTDPALTVWLLRRANAKLAGSGGLAETAGTAAEVIGADEVISLALAAPVIDDQPAQPGPGEFDLAGFWRHSIGCAAAAEMIAGAMSLPVDGELAFTCGLLHDIGKLVLWLLLPKSYGRVLTAVRHRTGNIAAYEKSLIGVDHTVAGRRLAERWRLGETLQQVLWLHHQPFEAIPDYLAARQMTGVVALADAITRRGGIGSAGNYSFTESPAAFAKHLGVDRDAVGRIESAAVEAVAAAAERLGLDEPDADTRLHVAMRSANAELARRNRSLRSELGRVSAQADALASLRGLASRLAAARSVADALIGIAQMLQPAADRSEPVAAYSIDRDSGEVTVVRLIAGDEPDVGLLPSQAAAEMLCADIADIADIADNPATLPASAIASLVNRTGQSNRWTDPGHYAHKPFRCQGRWVGGAVYLAKPANPAGPAGPGEAGAPTVLDVADELPATALAIVQAADKATALSEEMSGAAQRLSETQASLAESKSRAAIGRMAAGAAHEINTPLAVISGRAQIMADQADTDRQRRTWRLIADRAQEISDIITDLVAFASPDPPQPSALQVHDLIRDAVRQFRSSDHPQAASVVVDIETDEDLPPIRADRGQILDALAAVVSNAATVSAAGKVVLIRAEMDEHTGMAIICVSDQGPGMDAEMLEQVFTPFFSPQRAGRRRGMGLPKAKRYIANNGGKMWIDSRVGQGTTVYLQLPTR